MEGDWERGREMGVGLYVQRLEDLIEASLAEKGLRATKVIRGKDEKNFRTPIKNGGPAPLGNGELWLVEPEATMIPGMQIFHTESLRNIPWSNQCSSSIQ